MRTIAGLIVLMMLVLPCVASGQSLELYASAGPTVIDSGNSLAAGVGFSPISRLAFVFNFERTHLSSRANRDGNFVSSFRGGTLLLGTAELRFAPFSRARFGPFALAGFAAGVSHPNVTDTFPTRVSHNVRATFFGGGVQAPLGERVTIFADARLLIGAEGSEFVSVVPVRAGLAWRF